ncbi:hypothetical cytosolic protein [Coxiella burnetii Dugway 5J108-111]|uniref:Hypothetical cytosolic protein n=1 Tax=Coxiella burnetii (strain Dugway 5J108-111) TaxID=434922 RepID=B5XHD4_COXBN|nr:hypothetical cytosolic protein [Coxiella burnetii Dugway 5J108-111]
MEKVKEKLKNKKANHESNHLHRKTKTTITIPTLDRTTSFLRSKRG